MPDANTLLMFSIAALALTITPGPDMLLIASRSAAQGRGAGFATWSGIATGVYAHALAAAFGLSQLFEVWPAAYDVVRYAGALYFIYLAWITFFDAGIFKPGQSNAYKQYSFAVIFRQGFFTNILNPKVALFVLAFFPQFIDLSKGSVVLQIMILATIINILGFIVNGTVVLVASKASVGLGRNVELNRFLNKGLAVVFIALAFRLLLENHSV